MAICSIIRNKETNEIEQVLAPNGQPSILWDNLMGDQVLARNKEQTLRIWAKAYTSKFKADFGDWEVLQKFKEKLEANTDPGFQKFKKLYTERPEEAAFETAMQANSSISELQGMEMMLGASAIDLAVQLYPDVVVGDIYVPKMAGKVDVNGEPLSEYLSPDISESSVNYVLRSVQILSDPKIISSFNRFQESNPAKFRADLIDQIGAQQANIVLDWIERNRPATLQDVITGMLVEYSYTVEIETAIDKSIHKDYGSAGESYFFYNGFEYEDIGIHATNSRYFKSEEPITKEEFEEARALALVNTNKRTSAFYGEMTVPGGTNYRENNINTPNITPSIKGHAEFATSNGIGWFRSDDKGKSIPTGPKQYDGAGGLIQPRLNIAETPKTRRILEVQSDLFQKGRDQNKLVKYPESEYDNLISRLKNGNQLYIGETFKLGNTTFSIDDGWEGEAEKLGLDPDKVINVVNEETGARGYLTPTKFIERLMDLGGVRKLRQDSNNQNQFLQLLNKDNNWVTFFVKAIIQDSAKKGYEKVLFPVGDTANKVEGHSTLEEYIETKTDRINQLEKHLEDGFALDEEIQYEDDTPFDEERNPTKREVLERELKQLRHEIKRVETEGFSALRPIYKFYEEIVFNILKKQRYNPQRITDEYGNGWYEVQITDKALSPIVFNRTSANYKDVLSPENQRVFEKLIGEGLITKKRWKGMYFVPKTRNEIVVSTTFKDYRDGYWVSDTNKYRRLKALIDENQIGWLNVKETMLGGNYTVKIEPSGQVANQQKLFLQVGGQAFIAIADRLSKRLGISYEVIDAAKAIALTEKESIPWNGEGAFAYKGKVYVLEEAMTVENAIHEFAHFFVRAVSKESPYLMKKLYDSFKNDPVAKSRYVDFVEEMYADFPEEQRMEEAMVRAITDKALNLVDEKTGGVIINAVRKIWATIRNIIRNLFGVGVKNLNENTTLDQLAAILLGEKDGEVIDLGNRNTSYFQGLFPMFNREMANEMEKLSTSAIQTSINSFFTIANEHVNRLREDRDLSKLRDIMSNEKGSTLLKDEREILKLAKEFARTLEENTAVDRAALTSFAEAIEGQEIISQKMADHVATFDQDKDLSNQAKLAIFRKYSFMSKEWEYVLEKFNEALESSAVGRGKNPLSDAIANIRKNYEYINNKIKKFYKEDGLVTVFRDEIESNIYYQAAIEEQKARVAQLKADYERLKTPALGKKYEKEKELLRRYELTDDTIAKYLAGEMGDTNYYSMYLESYTSNPDPIVGTFTNWFLKQKFKAQVRAQERLSKFENQVSKIYKKLGYTASDFQKIAENLVQLETNFYELDTDGQPISRKVYKFISQYADDKDGKGWMFEYYRLLEEKENARARMFMPVRTPEFKGKTGLEEFRERSRRFEQFKLDYMFDEEGDRVREARLFWFRDEITHDAKMRQEDIFDRIRKNSFSDISKDESLEKAEENKALWREYRQLSSLTDKEGKPKEGRDLDIAKTIQEYRQKYGNLYEQVEIKGMFEANALSAKSRILDEVIGEGLAPNEAEATKHPEYIKRVNEWYRDNIRITLTQAFYDERQAIADRISAITSKLEGSDRKELDISQKWKDILEIVKGYRDEDNQPIGSDLIDSQLERIKNIQIDIDQVKERYNQINGFTEEEADEYYNFMTVRNMGMRLTPEEFERFQRLDAKAKTKLSQEDRLALNAAFDELKALQSKISTPYYTDSVNDWLAKSGSELRITQMDSEKILDPRAIDPILRENPEFRAWWDKNHIKKEYWDNSVQNVAQVYERLYVWNRTVPNDNLFKTLLEAGDFEGLSNYKSKFIDVKRSQEYYYRRLKPEFVNKKGKETEWVTHDNSGNWLPKPTERSATAAQKKYMADNKIPFAKDARFENAKYLDMRDNQKDHFELLELYKKFHLETQADLPRYARLGLEAPRMRKNSVENTDMSKMIEMPQSWWNNIKGWLGQMLGKRNDDYEMGSGNYNAADQAKTYVLTDLMGNQINSIPIKYMSYLEPDLVSMDIGKAVSMYAVSGETNKVLHEINPIANALKETLSQEENKPKDLDKKRRNIIQIVQNAFNRTGDTQANKKGSYNRLKIISNFLERELEGMTNIQQFGPTGEKIVNHIMKLGAWGSLGLNVFAAIKNDLAGRVQNNLEAVMGQNFTPSTLLKSNVEFAKLTQDLLKDYYSIGDKSMYTQMFLLFDPLNTYGQKAGTNFSKTLRRDFTDLKWIMGMQKFGEINIQGSAWLAMMLHQKVKYTDPDTKENKEIPYLDAWELNKDGVISLKEGVDPKWGKEGDLFLQFTSKVHKVNELNQGAYSEESQPEIHRMTLGKLFLFMRKFYVPAAVNRYGKKRFNAALGSFREGYWMPLMDLIGTSARSAAKGHVLNKEELKALYTPAERRAMLRTMSEIGFVGMCALLILALGFDGDDEDRYERLAENSWIHNFLIYQIMMIKSESETFIPFYGMGINETVRFLGTPSIAFNTAKRWVKVGQDFLAWTVGSDEARYKQDSGIYEEGQLKFLADLLNIVGWKNFAYLTSDQDLREGIKVYSSLQRRI